MFKVRFVNSDNGYRLNGEYVELNRVPQIDEYVCFDNCNKYKVFKVVMYLRGWQEYYDVHLDF